MRDDLLRITYFTHKAARFKIPAQVSLQELYEKIEAEEAAAKDLLPWVKFAEFGDMKSSNGSLRHDANVIAISGCEVDYDLGQMTFDEAVTRLRNAAVECIIHTSPSHTPAAPRWRVLAPTSTRLDKSARAALVARINGVLGGVIAAESFTISQSYYIGHLIGAQDYRIEMIDGRCIDLCSELDAGAIGKSGHTSKADGNGLDRESIDLDELTRRIMSGESLHPSVGPIAGSYAAKKVPLEACLNYIALAFTAAHVARYGGRWDEVEKYVRWVYAKENAKRPPKQAPAQTPLPPLVSYAELRGKEFPPMQWIVPKYIPAGLTLLAGKPKVGKSSLAVAITMACARGEEVLSERCVSRDAIYFALEDTEETMQEKTINILGSQEEWPANAWPVYDLPPLDQGCIDVLGKYLALQPSIKLMIIDTLINIKPKRGKGEDPYAADYAVMKALWDFSHEKKIHIIVIHHVRKATSEDIFDTISGTLGLNGGADTLIVLTRRSKDDPIRMATRGRRVIDEDKVVDFDHDMGTWDVLGEWETEDNASSKTRDLIKAALAGAPRDMTPAEIAQTTGLKEANVRVTMRRMTKDGEIKRTAYGSYHA